MKSPFHSNIWVIGGLMILTMGCSNEIIVRTDFDKSVSVQKLTRYSWLPQASIEARNSPLYYNELNDQRIKSAVNKYMAEKGYVLTTGDNNLLVHYHITIDERSTVKTEDSGYYYGQQWSDPRAEVRQYTEGTLIIDFMDAANCKLLWRGWAVSILDNSRTMSEELLNDAIEKIFIKFPDSAAKEATTQ